MAAAVDAQRQALWTAKQSLAEQEDLLACFIRSGLATALGVRQHARELTIITAGSVLAYFVTRHYMPRVAKTLYQSNLFGIDINKCTPEERQKFTAKRKAGAMHDESDTEFHKRVVPESLGILVGGVYLSVVMVLVVLLQPAAAISALSGPLTTITVMLLLGFVDDVLDVRWRYKLLLSMLGTLPLAMAYDGSASVLIPPTLLQYMQSLRSIAFFAGNAASSGSTAAAVSVHSVREALTDLVHSTGGWLQDNLCVYTGGPHGQNLLLYLGPLYLVYITLLCTFCTNSINIIAGVNGVEVGQSVVIAAASVVYNLCQLRLENVLDPSEQRSSPWLSSDHQIRALLLLIPFIGVSVALWERNRYPAKVFVGDSYTYFAGTVLAVAAVAGVYSKTLLLFFVPQVLNFLISTPQLFGFVECPRHRVPRWVPEKDVLTNSRNYTILNAILCVCGDMHEARLTRALLTFQAFTCGMGFLVRYLIAAWMYDTVQ